MLEPSVDRLGGPVAGVGPVEVGEDVSGSLLECAAEAAELVEAGGDPADETVDQGFHELAALDPVGVAVGGDHPLVGGPGDLHRGVAVVGEELVESVGLAIGDLLPAGVQRAAGGVERVAGSIIARWE